MAREKVRRLDLLLKEFASAIENVRFDIRASVPRLSLCDVPDEVILPIFLLICKDFESVVNISLVCKKFRRIALSSSKLWAGYLLTLNTPPHVIDTIASRSGIQGLTVRIVQNSDDWAEHRLDRLKKLFEYSAQWKVVVTVLSDKASQFIHAHFPNESLNRLVELDSSDGSLFYANRQASFYQDWSLPSLRVMKDTSWLPPPSFAKQAPNLVECRLSSKPSDFPKLFSFLNAIPRLEKLTLSIEEDGAMVQSTELYPPAIRSLKLIFPQHFDNIVTKTLSVLLWPGVTHLTLCSCGSDDRAIIGWKLGLPCLKRLCSCLESFSLFLSDGRVKLYFIDDILSNLPCTVKKINLFIHAYEVSPLFSHDRDTVSETSRSTHPCLTSLIIAHCILLEQSFFPEVATQLKLRNIKLKELSDIYDRNEVEETQDIFREAGVLCDGNTPL